MDEDKNLHSNEHRSDLEKQRDEDANRDPLSGQSGAHPVGTGIGAAAAGTLGTAIGAAAGPVGAVIGAVVGSVAGGLAGKATAEAFDPTVEDEYWRENYQTRPYVKGDRTYEDYQPGYRVGYEGYHRYGTEGKTYEQVEPDLQRHYETDYGSSAVGWGDARYAAQDAWNRVGSYSIAQDEDNYWRENYPSSSYFDSSVPYEQYQPAYRMGYEGYVRYRNSGRTYDEVEPELQRDYEKHYSRSGLGWERAKHAVRDAWFHVERAFNR